jgi:hypothetical protein
MAIDPATFPVTPYGVGQRTPIPILPLTPPRFYWDTNSIRNNTVAAVQPNGQTFVTFNANVGGDTIYLPYGQNEIHSVFVPSAGGATCFTTAGMSGCKLYIDRVGVTNDLVVYHANALAQDNPAALPNFEGPAVTAQLNALHVGAQAYWAGPPNNFVLNNVASFGRGVYRNGVVTEQNRKGGQGRTHVDFAGGTVVVGVLIAGHWSFYWQTSGSFDYRRPLTAPKAVLGLNRQVHNTAQRVVEYGVIWNG